MKVMSELERISLTQMIEKINELIDSGNGDAGRLYHILEFLKIKNPYTTLIRFILNPN